jgi:type I restriction enzyme S subunit
MSAGALQPIKYYCVGIFDGPHATPKEADSGPIFLGIKNITEDGHLDFSEIRYVSEDEYPLWTRRVVPEAGDVVLTYEATLHRYALIPEGFRGCLGRRVALVRPDPRRLDSRYLLYFFLSNAWRHVVEANIITGATVDRIPLEKLPDFQVNLPTVDVQSRIADVISTYDDLIENSRRRMALLEEAARQLYREWFVRLRFPGHEHTPSKNGVPHGWARLPFKEALVLQRGFDLPIQEREDGDIPIYASTGLIGFHNNMRVKGPGVVTGRSGTLGKVHFVITDYWPLNTALWVKEFKRVSPFYAVFLMREMDLAQYNGGASVPTLDRKAVHRLTVLVPSKQLLKQFDEFASAIFQQVSILEAQVKKLRVARDLLLSRIINGLVVFSDRKMKKTAIA